MRRALLASALLAFAVLVVAVAGLAYLSTRPAFHAWLEEAASRASGLDVRVRGLRIGRGLSVRADSVELAEAAGAPFARFEGVSVGMPWVRPSRHGLLVGPLQVAASTLDADRLPRLGHEGRAAALRPSRVDLVEVHLEATLAGRRRRYGPARLAIRRASADSYRIAGAVALDPGTPSVRVRGSAHSGRGSRTSLDLAVRGSGLEIEELWRAFAGDLPPGLSGKLSLDLRLLADAEHVRVDLGESGLVLEQARLGGAGASTSAGGLVMGGDAVLDASGSPSAHLTLRATGLSAHDASFARAAEGVSLTAEASCAFDLEHTGCRSVVSVLGGEALWDRFYLDLAALEPTVQAKVSVAHATLALELDELRLQSKGLGSWRGEVDAAPRARSASAKLNFEVLDAGFAYRTLLRDPYRETYPLLADVRLAGTVSGRVRASLKGSREYALSGRIRVRDGSLAVPSRGLEAAGIQAELPFDLGPSEDGDPKRARGSISLGRLELAGNPPQALQTRVTAGRNTLRFEDALRANWLGGTIALGPTSFTRLSGASRMQTALSISDIDTARLAALLGMPEARGTLSGTLDPVVYENRRIQTEGSLTAEVFGGRVTAERIAVRELFSSVPALALDLAFSEIRLAAVTSTAEIGRISGVVEGAIENLVIVAGQPVSMDMKVATTPRRGVPQTISVKALDQIAILGGSGGNRLTRGLFGFFDRYRYAKMGFSSHLENDRFTLSGVDQYDGKELLVVGSFLPPTVNVISRNRVVAFSDMVARLRRIRLDREPEIR